MIDWRLPSAPAAMLADLRLHQQLMSEIRKRTAALEAACEQMAANPKTLGVLVVNYVDGTWEVLVGSSYPHGTVTALTGQEKAQ